MQDLYKAVIALGKAIDDVDQFGWTCRTLGTRHAPKCVHGSITWAMGASCPMYMYELIENNTTAAAPLELLSVALVRTMPNHVRKHLAEAYDSNRQTSNYEEDRSSFERFLHALKWPEQARFMDLHEILIHANDAETGFPLTPLLKRDSARKWFSDALDVLAKELPAPIPVLFASDVLGAPEVVTA